MRTFKMTLSNADGSALTFEQIAAKFPGARLQRIDPELLDGVPDGELTAEQTAIVWASANPATEVVSS